MEYKIKLSILINIGLLFTLFVSPISWANDSSVGDDNGTIEFKYQPHISMDKESLFISTTNIQVDYIFTNTGDHDLTVPIAFPMPPMFFGTEDHTGIEDFKLWVDGKPVKTERKLVVMSFEGKDISKKIRKLGWSENDLINFLSTQEVPKGKKRLPSRYYLYDIEEPLFTVSEYFIWPQRFPSGKPVSIRHSYTPSISTGIQRPLNEIDYEKKACIDKNTRKQVEKLYCKGLGFGDNAVNWAILKYILVTADNWQGPIKDFKLTIKKQAPSDIVTLCFDGKLKKVDPVTFEFHQNDFKPKEDLDILFVCKCD